MSYNGKFRLPLLLAQGSPVFHSSCEGELGIALESLQEKRPHLGLCPGPNVPLQGSQGSQVCITDTPRESGLMSKGSKGLRSPFESRRAPLGALCGLKGVKPPVKFGERTWDCSPGHAGKDGPHLAMTEGFCGFSRAAALVWGFTRGTTGSSGSLSCGAREVRSPCAWRGGAHYCSRAMVGESDLKTH